ncbi:MAG: nitroreductase family protein [Desulfobacterium sp.]|jgi:nitroreductase/NAD-dependent dihydropyrimidine dehydrogenase PreA subunit|nr:nitroreductase family protein [Desulfobacterium sp.]
MTLFFIDPELCDRDGICAKECPARIITMADGLPQPVDQAETRCINCGHCVAVCPTKAFTHKNLKPEECIELDGIPSFTPEQAEIFLRRRRSIRTYRKKPVERTLLERAITLASHAPSGHNSQPVNWHVIHDTDHLRELDEKVIDWMRWIIEEKPEAAASMHLDMVVAGWEKGIDTITRKAPHLIIAHGNKKDPSAQTACTIAMTWLELVLPSLELGGCWCGYFNAAAVFWPPLQEALGLPEDHLSFGSMMVGHPTFTYRRIPPRNPARITWK